MTEKPGSEIAAAIEKQPSSVPVQASEANNTFQYQWTPVSGATGLAAPKDGASVKEQKTFYGGVIGVSPSV